MAIHNTFYTNKFKNVTFFYKEEESAGQVAFFEKAIPLMPRDRVLDLACGFGWHSIILTQKDYIVTGLDQSADYIERAKEKPKMSE